MAAAVAAALRSAAAAHKGARQRQDGRSGRRRRRRPALSLPPVEPVVAPLEQVWQPSLPNSISISGNHVGNFNRRHAHFGRRQLKQASPRVSLRHDRVVTRSEP